MDATKETHGKWKEIYKSRVMTPQQAAQLIKSGDQMYTPLGLGQPSMAIMDAIADRKDELENVEYYSCLTMRPYKIYKPEYRKTFILESGFLGSPVLHAMAKSEFANYFPNNGSAGILWYREHRMRRCKHNRVISIQQVSPPDEHGFVNTGLDSFMSKQNFDDAMITNGHIIAQINPHMPRCYGETQFHVSRFSAFVEIPEPLVQLPTPQATEVEVAMAKNVVSLLRDRDCIQIGIGAVPMMVSKLLAESDLRDLGVHTEMVPAGIETLVDRGVVTGKYKKNHTGKIIAGFAMGDKETYDFCANNPMVEFYGTYYTNSMWTIASEDNVKAINGSVEIDLLGQIVSESIGDTMISGSGGQCDFAIGAFWSKGGRAINLVPSTTSDGSISRIVPYLKPGSRITVPRNYAGYVVTEYGVADLYGLSEPERAAELIKVAHPKFREELEKNARERHLLYPKFYPVPTLETKGI
ncbi:MAG TPA: acetyl-CoA hydrolase/transferase C-terminal domain-containing protein [Smithellaceae bacterium]|nr:acetyl-CoA hydrolase/transferase C-terminal domain-containing protein [Smithellaceae bacterium]